MFDPNHAYNFLGRTNFSGIAIPDVQEVETYDSIVALSARQVMGAYVLTMPPTDGGLNSSRSSSEPFMF